MAARLGDVPVRNSEQKPEAAPGLQAAGQIQVVRTDPDPSAHRDLVGPVRFGWFPGRTVSSLDV